MRVHSGTLIQTTFTLVTEDGDLSDPRPCHIHITEFSEAAFVEALKKLQDARRQIDAEDAAKAAAVDPATGASAAGTSGIDSADLVDGGALGRPE